MSLNKKSYFQGGGGENEPTPGKKKYKSDPAILVQPRFEEPFYRNYDYLDTEGIDGEPQYGPGSGWNHIMEHKSVKDFLDFRRKRLKGKYVADDFWIEDNEANRKQRVEKMKVRTSLLSKMMIKTGQYMLPPKEHGTSIYDAKNSPYQGTPKAPNKSKADDNDGRNFDYGAGLYMNMDKYDSVDAFREGDKNSIDFAIDDQIKSAPIIGEMGSYPASAQIGGYLDKYLPLDDFGGKSPDKLNFGRDYDDDDGLLEGLDLGALEQLMEKYLSKQEPGIFGLPDGIHPSEDEDPSATINHINPEAGETDSGNTMYEDKWNI
jgi:hypothetical protein